MFRGSYYRLNVVFRPDEASYESKAVHLEYGRQEYVVIMKNILFYWNPQRQKIRLALICMIGGIVMLSLPNSILRDDICIMRNAILSGVMLIIHSLESVFLEYFLEYLCFIMFQYSYATCVSPCVSI